MVGISDYIQTHRLRNYLSLIYKVLKVKGIFLGANISSKEEAVLAHKAGRWPLMIYRSKEELLKLLLEAGFQESRIWIGQCGLYSVWIAQK